MTIRHACFARLLLVAAVMVPSGLGAQEAVSRGTPGEPELPTITHTDDGMAVELPDGERLELAFEAEPPTDLEPPSVERSRALLKSGGCDPYMNRYAGYAPIDPASYASLGLPPIDADCDGAADRPWYVRMQLDWHSVDSRLGAVDLSDVRAVIIRISSRGWSRATLMLFAAAADGEFVSGYVKERCGRVWGEALVGRHRDGVVRYRLFAAADEPLQVRILESGVPLEDGRIFDRPVALTAAVDGGSGPAELSAAIDGSPYTLGEPYGEEGFHTIEVTATSGDETSTATATFTIDLGAPVFTDIEPPDGGVVGGPSLRLSGLVSADAVLVMADGAPPTSSRRAARGAPSASASRWPRA